MMVFSRCGRMLLHLCFVTSGASALITLKQPPVVTAPLGHDVLLPCEIQKSQDEVILESPVLYWVANGEQLSTKGKTSNSSYVLKNVKWSDVGIYECKMSLQTKIEGGIRRRGNKTTLIIYDTVTFNLTNHNDSLLRCEVKVSQDLGFSLSVVKDRCILQSLDSAVKRSINRTVSSLSRTVPLRGKGTYECRLQLGEDLITSRTFHSELTGGEDERLSNDFNLKQHPEPWFLYSSLLLVPILVLLILGTAMLMQR